MSGKGASDTVLAVETALKVAVGEPMVTPRHQREIKVSWTDDDPIIGDGGQSFHVSQVIGGDTGEFIGDWAGEGNNRWFESKGARRRGGGVAGQGPASFTYAEVEANRLHATTVVVSGPRDIDGRACEELVTCGRDN